MNEITPNYMSDQESEIRKFIKNVSAFIQKAKTHYKITELKKLNDELNDIIRFLENSDLNNSDKKTKSNLLIKLKKLQKEIDAIKWDAAVSSEVPAINETLSRDPSHDEMVSFLKQAYRFEHDDYDIERAIYWFAYLHYEGQSSNLYSALSTSKYHPGPMQKAPVYGGDVKYIYRVYDIEYDFSQLNEFQKAVGVLKSIGDIGIPPGIPGGDGDSDDDLPDELIFECLKSEMEIDEDKNLPDEDDLLRDIKKFILVETEVPSKSFQYELQHMEEVESEEFTSDAMFDMLIDKFQKNKLKENMKIKINQLIEETVNEVLNENQNGAGLSDKTRELIGKWLRENGSRPTAIKIIDSILRQSVGLTSADLSDSTTFANGLDEIEIHLKQGDFFEAIQIAKDTAKEMIDGELNENVLGEIKTWADATKNPHFSKLILFEVTPPGMEDFINCVKPHIMAKYGNNKGQKIAYALAWKQYYK